MRRSAGDTLILGPRPLAVSRKHRENRPPFAARSRAWPTIWPVLTSIANGGNDSESSFRPWHERSFIDSAWMTWGVEVIFVALLCFVVFHEYRRRRYW